MTEGRETEECLQQDYLDYKWQKPIQSVSRKRDLIGSYK